MKRDDLFRQVLAASERGQPGLTIELSKRYLAKYPDDYFGHLYFGLALQDIGRYAEARASYNHALSVSAPEKHERVYRQLGSLEEDQSHLALAETWYRRAIDAKPHDATCYIYLGAMLSKAGRLEEAEALFRQATNCTEGCIDEAYLNLGFVMRAKEQYLEALQHFREALTRDPLYEAAQRAIADMEGVLFEFPHV